MPERLSTERSSKSRFLPSGSFSRSEIAYALELEQINAQGSFVADQAITAYNLHDFFDEGTDFTDQIHQFQNPLFEGDDDEPPTEPARQSKLSHKGSFVSLLRGKPSSEEEDSPFDISMQADSRASHRSSNSRSVTFEAKNSSTTPRRKSYRTRQSTSTTSTGSEVEGNNRKSMKFLSRLSRKSFELKQDEDEDSKAGLRQSLRKTLSFVNFKQRV